MVTASAKKHGVPLAAFQGVCFDRAQPDDVESSEPSDDRGSRPSTPSRRDEPPPKKGLGEKCKFNGDCASKKCGTISDGAGLHKCITR